MAKKQTKEDLLKHLKGTDFDATGYEDISTKTMAIPFIRILQDLSPQLKKTKPEYIQDADSGMIFNTISEKIYETPLKFVVGKFERYYVEWKPNRGGFVAQHLPEDIESRMSTLARDEKNKLFDPASGNNLVDTYIYYVLLPDYIEDGVCIIALTSSFLKEARKLNRNLTTTTIPGTNQKALPYFMIWNMAIVEMSNDQGDWFGPKITLDDMVSSEQLAIVTDERKQLPNKTVDLARLEDLREDTATEKESGKESF